jgi:hypothetical protein
MEYETLAETERKLPKFSDQLGVPVSELRPIPNQEWLPNIDVVRLPSRFREVDPRAVQARLQLRASLVPKPEQRTPASAIVRELAISRDSLSGVQLAALLDTSVRPPVAKIRAFLRAHDGQVYRQVRHGGFVPGLTIGCTTDARRVVCPPRSTRSAPGDWRSGNGDEQPVGSKTGSKRAAIPGCHGRRGATEAAGRATSSRI